MKKLIPKLIMVCCNMSFKFCYNLCHSHMLNIFHHIFTLVKIVPTPSRVFLDV